MDSMLKVLHQHTGLIKERIRRVVGCRGGERYSWKEEMTSNLLWREVHYC